MDFSWWFNPQNGCTQILFFFCFQIPLFTVSHSIFLFKGLCCFCSRIVYSYCASSELKMWLNSRIVWGDVMTMATLLIYSCFFSLTLSLSYPVKTKSQECVFGQASSEKIRMNPQTNEQNERSKKKHTHKAILIKIYPLIFDVIFMLLCCVFLLLLFRTLLCVSLS